MSSRKKKYRGVSDSLVEAVVAAAAADPRLALSQPVVEAAPRPAHAPVRVPVRRHEPRVPRRLTDAEMLAKLSPWAGIPEIDLVLEELARRVDLYRRRTGEDIGGGWRVVDEVFVQDDHTARAEGPQNQHTSSDVLFESIMAAFDRLHSKPGYTEWFKSQYEGQWQPTTPWDVL